MNYIVLQAKIMNVPESKFIDVLYINSPASSKLGQFIEATIYSNIQDTPEAIDIKRIMFATWQNIYDYIVSEFAPADTKVNNIKLVQKFQWDLQDKFTTQENKIRFELLVRKAGLTLSVGYETRLLVWIFIDQIPVLIKTQIINMNLIGDTSFDELDDFDIVVKSCLKAESKLKQVYVDNYKEKLLEAEGSGLTYDGSVSSNTESTFYVGSRDGKKSGNKPDGNLTHNNNPPFYVTSTFAPTAKDGKYSIQLTFAKKPANR